MKLIDKDALVAEIERRQKIHFNDYHINRNGSPADYGACNALTQILFFIDTLEVKEVDLEKENKIKILADIIFNAAKHGYMPYDTQDEYCAMEIAKKNIEKFITQKA